MKDRSLWMALLALALCLAGCKMQTQPAYSPDGKSMLFEKGDALYRKVGAKTQLVANDVTGNVCWSPDGSKVAFTSANRTTILSFSPFSKRTVEGVHFPYMWQNGLLKGVADADAGRSKLVTVDTSNGGKIYEQDLDFQPSEMISWASGDGAVLMRGGKTYSFDGFAAKLEPEFERAILAGSAKNNDRMMFINTAVNNSEVLTVRATIWRKSDGDRKMIAFELPNLPGKNEMLLGLAEAQANANLSRAAMVFLAITPSARDKAVLTEIMMKYGLFDSLVMRPPSKADEAKVEKILDRSPLTLILMAGPVGGNLKEIYRTGTGKKTPDTIRFALRPDGRELFIQGSRSTRTVQLK